MIETLSTVLPIVIYFLLIIFLIIVIVLGLKLIITIDTINAIIKDVQHKLSALDNIFRVMSTAADKISGIGSKIIDTVMGTINKVIGLTRKDDDDYV